MTNKFRRSIAWKKRNEANNLANQRPHPRHISNGDEQKFRHTKDSAECHVHEKPKEKVYKVVKEPIELKGKPSYLMSFTKGMPHDIHTGLLADPTHFQYFVRAIDSGDPRDFRDTPLGPDAQMGGILNCGTPNSKWKSSAAARPKHADGPVKVRSWESQSAGLAYELEGPDAQAVTMPPHPTLGSDELTAEIGEVYVQALLRDVPFNALSAGSRKNKTSSNFKDLKTTEADVRKVRQLTNKLNDLNWFGKSECDLCLDDAEKERHRGAALQPGNAFRGITNGDEVGPYLSQFLLIGDGGISENKSADKGFISYGAITIDQRVRVAKAKKDYMTTWEEWLDVQNAANTSGQEEYDNVNARRFMHTPRDLATYVHFDALYEAYLNACLIMLANKTPFDPGIPFQEPDNRDHQQGFAHFGGPHILSLVTEVATRALKAVRFQKYNVHRRCRPEVLAARISNEKHLSEMAPELTVMSDELSQILAHVKKHNLVQNKSPKVSKYPAKNNYLLPMAFSEGSPMHPAYGAGHATVAGACVTILKAFFDCKHHMTPNGTDSNMAYVSVNNGKNLGLIPVLDQEGKPAHLTIEGELNKLASNISIGRNWGGVHYFTDYYESILMGEQIAIGILEEQKLMFGENYSMTIPLFGGNSIRI